MAAALLERGMSKSAAARAIGVPWGTFSHWFVDAPKPAQMSNPLPGADGDSRPPAFLADDPRFPGCPRKLTFVLMRGILLLQEKPNDFQSLAAEAVPGTQEGGHSGKLRGDP